MQCYFFLATLACFLIMAATSRAASVSNQADVAESIDAKENGYFKPYSIEQGDTVYFIAGVHLRYAGREFFLEADEAFTIWNNGYNTVKKIRH